MKKINLIYFRIFAFKFALLLLLTGCEWDRKGVDFRNYIRDKHPYSVLKEVDLNSRFAYQVNDTIKNEIWIYTSEYSENSVRGVLVDSLI